MAGVSLSSGSCLAREMTPNQILDALTAFGYEVVYDPGTHPDGPTEEDMPDLLGRLSSLIDFAIGERVRPNSESMSEFQAGYMAAIASREDFFEVLIVRAIATGALPDTDKLRGLKGVEEFQGRLGAAVFQLSEAMKGHDVS